VKPAVPDLVLERYRLGELPVADQQALARRIDGEPELRQRLEALERSDEKLRRRLEAPRLAASVRSRLESRSESTASGVRFGRPWALPAGLAAAAAVAFAIATRTPATAPPLPPSSTAAPAAPPATPAAVPSTRAASPSTPAASEGIRLKGSRPALSLFRKTAQGSETLADGDTARAGDVIRVGYRSFGRRYGVIVSLDGRGGLTRHLPEAGTAAAPLESGDVVLLAHAYELDDAPSWERFFFVTAEAPFEVAAVEDAARRAAAEAGRATGHAPEGLALPKTLEQSAFLLTKERRP
jgi:hypothetical protein